MTKKRIQVLIHKTINPKVQQGEIILVSYGYARNYLIPQRIASVANKNVINQSYKYQKKLSQKNLLEYNHILATKNLLERINKFSIKRKVGVNYRFFGSITPNNIIKTISTTTGILINKKQIELQPMRTTGLYEVKLQLLFDIKVMLKIQILPVYS